MTAPILLNVGLCANCGTQFPDLSELLKHECTVRMDSVDARVRRIPIMQPDYPASPHHPIVHADGPTVDQTPMSIGAIIQTLKAINPRQAFLVRLPNDVIAYIAPFHAACMKAVGREQKRTAWRAWNKAIETLHKSMRASAQASN